MVLRALKFIRLPILLMIIFTIGRFTQGLLGVPYMPRGTATFGIVMLTITTAIYWGALSKRIGRFGWLGTVVIGVLLGLVSQILIFLATLVSYVAGVDTYFTHWDALNLQEGQTATMGEALGRRAGGLVAGPIIGLVMASIGRLLAPLAPAPNPKEPEA
jgi:hypothetical protein